MGAPSRVKAAVRVERREHAPPADQGIRATDPVTIVIFGASGDLSRRKLIPALHQLELAGYLPERYAIVGLARTPLTDASFRDAMAKVLQESASAPGNDEARGAGGTADHDAEAHRTGGTADHDAEAHRTGGTADASDAPAKTERLLGALYYLAGDSADAATFTKLKEKLEAVERERGLPGNRLYYLSVAPELFPVIVQHLTAARLIHRRDDPTWSRVIIEKPFGTDLESARELNTTVTAALDESQIYRIDHYLGKETVQNILSFRFGNSIFEPLFSEKYVANVQITVAETLGMEGRRGAYYDGAGALRDIVQNHVLQLLCLIAMEPPSALEAQAIRDEKVKVLRTLVPLGRDEVAAATVRGQYGPGTQDGQPVKGYREEEGVDPASLTETYVALRVQLDSWRWAGVPFFLRTGKRLARRCSEIAVEFKQPPKHLFRHLPRELEAPTAEPRSNDLILRIQPNEGISLSFACKRPGMRIALQEVAMDFLYGEAFRDRSPEAYERLLLDALRGDASLFTRSDEVEHAWRFITSIHEGWAALPPPRFPNYAPGSEGPDEANRLLEGTQARWRSLREE